MVPTAPPMPGKVGKCQVGITKQEEVARGGGIVTDLRVSGNNISLQ